MAHRLIGGGPGWLTDVRGRILDALERAGRRPVHFTLREEEGKRPFDRAEALLDLEGPWPGAWILDGDGWVPRRT